MDVKIPDEDSVSFIAVLDDRGRITIPASVRRKLRISFGLLFSIALRREKQ